MKSIIKSILTTVALGATALGAGAQNTETAYFLDDYTYRYQMNPAIGNSTNFVGMPALANMNIGMEGNLKVTSVLYNVNGRTTTFMNPAIDAGEVLSRIKNVNRIGADVKLNILSGGFKAWGGYNTVGINARVGVQAHLPKALFSLLKEGLTNRTYDITDVRAHANAYAEIAFGHSRKINSQWRVGGTLKFLVGGAAADVRLKEAYLELGEDDWKVTSNGEANMNVKGFTYDTKTNKHTGHEYVSGANVDNTGVNGFGLAFDLGAEYTPKFCKGLKISAALLDFGFISWNNNVLATTNGPQTFNTDRYTFNPNADADNSFSKEWKLLRNQFSAIYELDPVGDTGSKARMLHATMNIGAEYTVQTFKKLKFGFLNTTYIAGPYSWTNFRLSGNYAPCKIFDLAASIAEGTYGFDFGWMLNLHVTGFNFFLGMDHTLGKLAKQGLPLSCNAGVNLGMNFLF